MLIFKRFQSQDVDDPTPRIPEYGCPISPANTQAVFAGCGDLMTRVVAVGGTKTTAFLCWLDGTVSGEDVAQQVLRPLTDPARFGDVREPADLAARLESGAVYGADMKRTDTMDSLAEAVAFGCCALVLDGVAFLFQLRTDQHRSVQEPTIEKSVKGSKDAFVETLRVNTGLVRSRLRTPRLKLRQTTVGAQSPTAAAMLWLEGAADPDLPRRLCARLESMTTAALLRPDDLEGALADCPASPFPQLIHTERPDTFAAALLAGRVGILAEGIPVGFLAPAALPDFLFTSEDGAQHPLTAACLRALRWAALGITLLFPALYVSIAMFHAEMLPTELLLSVINAKQSVPFSTAAEVLGMLLAFELLQEAGLRLPEPVGQTMSIIGALIVGQSAVEAKVISPIAVIVVALAGIAGYTCPSQDLSAALRLCRFLLTAAAALTGLFGVALGTAALIWHLCSLESGGRAYVPAGQPGRGPALLRRREGGRRP